MVMSDTKHALLAKLLCAQNLAKIVSPTGRNVIATILPNGENTLLMNFHKTVVLVVLILKAKSSLRAVKFLLPKTAQILVQLVSTPPIVTIIWLVLLTDVSFLFRLLKAI